MITNQPNSSWQFTEFAVGKRQIYYLGLLASLDRREQRGETLFLLDPPAKHVIARLRSFRSDLKACILATGLVLRETVKTVMERCSFLIPWVKTQGYDFVLR